MNSASRNTFSGSLGFVLAAAGSAVGLGNIWRFPYLAARDGGGLFLFVYILLAITFGFTLLITEVAIGRRSQRGPLTAYRFFNKRWSFIGVFAFIVPTIIYPYYCVIGGWVLKYFVQYLTFSGSSAVSDDFFTSYITGNLNGMWEPLVYMLAFAAMCFYVVYKGVEKGIEKFSKIVMPMLLVLVVFICIYSLFISHTDPSTGVTRTGLQGAYVYLVPNFEGVTFSKLLSITMDACSQLFFSLSIAMGIMIAYGSYMKKDVNLGKAVDRIEICDTLIAVLAGLMIIPAVYVFMGTEGMGAGPGLIFVALPKIFHSLGVFGPFIGLAFFLLVLFAATTSAVSILEACVSSTMDAFHWTRTKSIVLLQAGALVASVIVCLGYNVLYFEYELPNGAKAQILDVFDYLSNNLLMPIVAICTCVLFGWVVKPRLLVGEMRLNGYKFLRKKMYIICLKYIVPLILTVLFLNAFGLFDGIS